jgi:hypothetical protein
MNRPFFLLNDIKTQAGGTSLYGGETLLAREVFFL